jgi:Ferritin-like domain
MEIAMAHAISRRHSLLLGASSGLALASLCNRASFAAEAASPTDIKDEDIFQFALNLEYMEAEYYLRGTRGKGLDASDIGADPGKVVGGDSDKVPFKSKAIKEFLEEVAENELAHVRFYRKTLGGSAVDRPAIDFDAGFSAAAKGSGLGSKFNAFENEMNFLLGGMLFEDVGVTAYAGAATALKEKEHLEAAAGILAVEAYHMGMARSQLYEMGEEAWKAANALSDARDKLDGPGDKDQGIRVDGKANIVPSNPDGIAFSRTPQEVLHIVYLTEQSGVSRGGFYPNGMNGTLKST